MAELQDVSKWQKHLTMWCKRVQQPCNKFSIVRSDIYCWKKKHISNRGNIISFTQLELIAGLLFDCIILPGIYVVLYTHCSKHINCGRVWIYFYTSLLLFTSPSQYPKSEMVNQSTKYTHFYTALVRWILGLWVFIWPCTFSTIFLRVLMLRIHQPTPTALSSDHCGSPLCMAGIMFRSSSSASEWKAHAKWQVDRPETEIDRWRREGKREDVYSLLSRLNALDNLITTKFDKIVTITNTLQFFTIAFCVTVQYSNQQQYSKQWFLPWWSSCIR